MKHFSFSFASLAIATLVAMPALARADIKPDFDEDAKPILSQQAGLVEYVESRFEIKDTGIAKVPGDDDHPPQPPYIFKARPLGSNGPYNLRLLIQPGAPGHILGIVQEAPQQPAVAAKSPVIHPAPMTSAAPAAQTPAALTSDTPSGPIIDSSKAPAPNSPSNSPDSSNLTPPPDPAPTPH